MKVLITGGAGYIGSTVASACLDSGITPVTLDSLVTGRREFARGPAFYQGDISDGALLDKMFAEHPDIAAVVHCAARFYQPGPDGTVDEDSPIQPASPYARTKAVCEGMLADIADGTALRVVSLRYFNPIGADPKLRSGLQRSPEMSAPGGC